jgi:O-antigen/teichoic acid export membrane protein
MHMLRQMLAQFKNSGDLRGKQIFRHIAYSSGLKLVNAAVSFLVIPLYLQLLTDVSFGIWLTVSAVLSWFNFFDLGMGNGLRNRFAQALAKGDHVLARTYVSTTYTLLTAISAVVLGLFLIAGIWVDWAVVFAAPSHLAEDVNTMMVILVVLFCPQFVLQLIKMIVTADQRPALANLINTIVNVLQLAGVGVLLYLGIDGLVPLAFTLAAINFLVPLAANIWLFAKRYRTYAPSTAYVNMDYARDLLGLGFTFFVLQGAALVVFMTDNLIISQVLGPEEVPAYNISFRYFNLGLVFFAMITTPFWSAFTDAYAKHDFAWIRKMLRRLLIAWAGFAVCVIVMFFAAPFVFRLWIGDALQIPMLLNAFMAAWIIVSSGLSIFATFLSGVGKLRLSLYQAVFVMVINIPLSIYLAGFEILGSAGVILATLICAVSRLFFQPRQTWLILNGNAKGVWAR